MPDIGTGSHPDLTMAVVKTPGSEDDTLGEEPDANDDERAYFRKKARPRSWAAPELEGLGVFPDEAAGSVDNYTHSPVIATTQTAEKTTRPESPPKEQAPESRAKDAAEPPPSPVKYGARWVWSEDHHDYIPETNGKPQFYTEYQKPLGGAVSASTEPPPDVPSAPPSRSSSWKDEGALKLVPRPPSPSEGLEDPDDKQWHVVLVKQPKAYEEPLDGRFKTVDNAKRFFTKGRIFKTAWFEPGGPGTPGRRSDLEWTDNCPPFHGAEPHAKFRWFVVVRKRLHHSLCFSITTYGGKGAAKLRRGRAMDFVVLYRTGIVPAQPDEEEGITRHPMAVIIEDEDQFISPLARLDCSRIYTVEDNLRVMKIGRVHAQSLPLLENYFQASVE